MKNWFLELAHLCPTSAYSWLGAPNAFLPIIWAVPDESLMVRRSHLGKKGDTHKDDLAIIIIIILRKLATWHSLRRLLYFLFLLQLNSFYLILDTLPPSQSQKCQIFLVRLGYTSCYAKTWAMSLKIQTKPNAYVSSVRSYLTTYKFFTMYREHLILKKWNM